MRGMLVMAGVVFLAGCNSGSDLEGTWVSDGYFCMRGGLTEQVSVRVAAGRIVATKITGDDCVPAGHVTFEGTEEALTCMTGAPGAPSSSHFEDRLVRTPEGFDACRLSFRRVP